MEWLSTLLIVIGALVIFFPVAFIWYLNIGGVYSVIKLRRKKKLLDIAIPDLTCSLDADCPAGYVCFGNRCVPAGR